MKIKLHLILILLGLLSSCSEFEFNDEKDFRNFIRDRHPYSELIDMDLNNFDWNYQVSDTINNEIWIYIGSKYKATNYKVELLNKNK